MILLDSATCDAELEVSVQNGADGLVVVRKAGVGKGVEAGVAGDCGFVVREMMAAAVEDCGYLAHVYEGE